MMKRSIARTYPLPNNGEITDDWDIDRWENDGGRSLDIIHEHCRD